MAYPVDYEVLEEIPYEESMEFSNMLTDGLIESTDPIVLDSKYFVYAKYSSGTPKVDIVDTIMDEYLVTDSEGTFMDKVGVWKFEIDIPANETGVNNTMWREMKVMVKVHSDDSDMVFNSHVEVVRDACSMADLCETVSNIQSTEKAQTEEILELQNGWRAIF